MGPAQAGPFLLFDGTVTRVDFEPGDRPGGLYRLLNSVVVPRPIAWVSTRSVGGVDNLAPHSFFTVACADPAIVQFTSIGRKDSLANATATGEFVVNLAPEPLFEKVNATATDFPPTTTSSPRSASSVSRAASSRRRASPARRWRSSACSTGPGTSARPSSSSAASS